jgi:hypothetical protein
MNQGGGYVTYVIENTDPSILVTQALAPFRKGFLDDAQRMVAVSRIIAYP